MQQGQKSTQNLYSKLCSVGSIITSNTNCSSCSYHIRDLYSDTIPVVGCCHPSLWQYLLLWECPSSAWCHSSGPKKWPPLWNICSGWNVESPAERTVVGGEQAVHQRHLSLNQRREGKWQWLETLYDDGQRHSPADLGWCFGSVAAYHVVGSWVFQKETDRACPAFQIFSLWLIHVGINVTARGNSEHVKNHYRALGAGEKQRTVSSRYGYSRWKPRCRSPSLQWGIKAEVEVDAPANKCPTIWLVPQTGLWLVWSWDLLSEKRIAYKGQDPSDIWDERLK